MWNGRRNTEDDAQLVNRVRAGDAAAFQLLVDQYFGLVYSVALARLKHREAAEDLAQEVFLRAYLHLHTLHNPQVLGAWLVRMARNLAADWTARDITASRLVAMVPLQDVLPEEEIVVEPPVRDQIDKNRMEQLAQEAILRLPPEQREVVMLYFMQEMTYQQIGARLGVHRTTVQRHVEGALVTLRKLLDSGTLPKPGALKPPSTARVRTATLLAAVSALPSASKAALVEAAAASAPAGASLSLSVPAASGPIIQTAINGAMIMAKTKTGTAVAGLAVLLLGGTGYHYFQAQASAPLATTAKLQSATTDTGNSTAKHDGITGAWHGVWNGGKSPEHLIVVIEPAASGSYMARATSSYLGIEAEPANSLSWDGTHLNMTFNRFGLRFTGKLNGGDTISGEWAPIQVTAGPRQPKRREPIDPWKSDMKRVTSDIYRPAGTAVVLPPTALDRLAGMYAADPRTWVRLRKEGTGLIMETSDETTYSLLAASDSEFFLPNNPTQIVFGAQPGTGGKIDRVLVRKVMGETKIEKHLRKVQ